jgi:DNA repair exonuclease SbcCD ATPase subunit
MDYVTDTRIIKKYKEIIIKQQEELKQLKKYKMFIEMEKDTKLLYTKFKGLTDENQKLKQIIETQKEKISKYVLKNSEINNENKELKNSELTFANKKKFYELQLIINELEEKKSNLEEQIRIQDEKYETIEEELNEMKGKEDKYVDLLNNIKNDIQSIID